MEFARKGLFSVHLKFETVFFTNFKMLFSKFFIFKCRISLFFWVNKPRDAINFDELL